MDGVGKMEPKNEMPLTPPEINKREPKGYGRAQVLIGRARRIGHLRPCVAS